MICFSIKLEQQSGLIFFPECTSWDYYKEYHVIEWVHTECVGLINLFVDSLDNIYGKMPKLLEQHEWYSLQKYKISVHTKK